MTTFLVVATFRAGTVMDEVFAVRTEEAARVAALRADGRLGAVQISLERGTVFLETFAADPADARSVIETLPMARWWELDLYPIIVPTIPG